MNQLDKINSLKRINRIIIVGNGFDLALGMKTQYKEFIFELLTSLYKELITKGKTETGLIMFPNERNFGNISETISYFENNCKAVDLIVNEFNEADIEVPNKFFNALIKNFSVNNWTDIEEFYFQFILSEFRNQMSRSGKITDNSIIKDANNCMDILTDELKKYVIDEEKKVNLSKKSKNEFSMLFNTFTSKINPENFDFRFQYSYEPSDVLFLNFNYSNTLDQFIDFNQKGISEIKIHGSAHNIENPIIFGYGDDTSNEYSALENSKTREFFEKIKPFHYPKTNNYHRLLGFLEIPFEVFIIGHSCGISDKTMLKTIFEHENCILIKNFHYDGEKEEFWKRMEISRLFSDKILFRNRLLNFDKEAKIPQANSSNGNDD